MNVYTGDALIHMYRSPSSYHYHHASTSTSTIKPPGKYLKLTGDVTCAATTCSHTCNFNAEANYRAQIHPEDHHRPQTASRRPSHDRNNIHRSLKHTKHSKDHVCQHAAFVVVVTCSSLTLRLLVLMTLPSSSR